MAGSKFWNAYRVPLYSYVRHRGFSPADAEDITQSFFVDLLERDVVRQVDRAGSE